MKTKTFFIIAGLIMSLSIAEVVSACPNCFYNGYNNGSYYNDYYYDNNYDSGSYDNDYYYDDYNNNDYYENENYDYGNDDNGSFYSGPFGNVGSDGNGTSYFYDPDSGTSYITGN